jgi:hypothetical protein
MAPGDMNSITIPRRCFPVPVQDAERLSTGWISFSGTRSDSRSSFSFRDFSASDLGCAATWRAQPMALPT